MKTLFFILSAGLCLVACNGGSSSSSNSGGGGSGSTVTVNCAPNALCAPTQISAIPAK